MKTEILYSFALLIIARIKRVLGHRHATWRRQEAQPAMRRHLGVRISIAVVVLVASIATSDAARAGLAPYSISASESIAHDSNVYRTPSGGGLRADWIASTTFGAGVDETIGRSRVQANGSVQANRYLRETELDNTGYGLHASWQASTIGHVSGSVVYDTSRTLTSFATLSSLGSSVDPRLRVPSLQTAQQLALQGQLGVASTLAIDLGLTHRSLGYSAHAYVAQENREDTTSLGLAWRPSGILNVNLGLRHGHGLYPNGVQIGPDAYIADSYDREDVDLGAVWLPSGASTIEARISRTQQRNREASLRNFSGTTGSLGWTWRPRGKLVSTLTLARDVGNDSTFLNFNGNARAALQNYDQVSSRVVATIEWSATSKLQSTATFTWMKRRLVNGLAFGSTSIGSSTGDDRLLVGSATLRYTATRLLATQCSVSREYRTAATPLSYPYDATVLSCLGSFRWQ